MAFIYFLNGGASGKPPQEESFFRLLREYDRTAREIANIHSEIEILNRELDRIEKKAIGVEARLSVLKRRRNLVKLYPPCAEDYRQSIERAVKAYPWSQPLAALAAAAVVRDTALNNEAEEKLRGFLPMLTDPAFNSLRLGLHILLGDFKNPQRAAALPKELVGDGTEEITTDLLIVKVLRDDPLAAAEIQSILNSPVPPSDGFIRFAAEYHYDFGDLRRSAELFSRIETEEALIRQADALQLAGFNDSARSIWSILAAEPVSTAAELSLYNLAVTAESQEEAAGFLEKLARTAGTKTGNSNTDSRQFGLIRYSRLLAAGQAIAVLEGAEQLKPSDYPFIDLEIRKRRAYFQEPGRQLAETWLLLDRHPENEDLYRWAAWFIFYQRFYSEAAPLFRRAEQYRLDWRWAPVYEAVRLMQEGGLDAAEGILWGQPRETAEWAVFANLGRILEAQRSPSRALEQYELAAAKVQNPKTAAQIQVRIAKCLAALGRGGEALRVLNYALDLDPENLSAQLELERYSPY